MLQLHKYMINNIISAYEVTGSYVDPELKAVSLDYYILGEGIGSHIMWHLMAVHRNQYLNDARYQL